jgi:alcohol dehydrogenase class IV
MNDSQRTGNWNYPNSISAGAGRVTELADLCMGLGIRAPLIVTDPGVAALPMLERAQQSCLEAGLECAVFSAIKGNPTGTNIDAGVEAYCSGMHDGVIAFGGGSALDAGKAVALMCWQDRPIWDFEDIGDNWTRVREEGIAPVVAVPTTAGTGSEVGRAAIITDEQQQMKKIIFHPAMLPQRVILDPELSVGLPPDITAATGMDALSHNLEALCAPAFHPMADGIALEGIRRVKDALPKVVARADDIDARMDMLVASTMGATAFQKGLGAMHALAHPLGALYDAHHGLLNAILMPYVLVANREAIAEPLARASSYLDLHEGTFEAFLDWVLELRGSIGIPSSLGEIGISDNQQQRVGEMAAADPSAAGNPVPLSPQEYQTLFARAVAGVL